MSTGCQCTDDAVREILGKFPAGKRETLIPLLQAVQERFGFLPEESIDAIGKHLGVATAKVYGVATFYNQFRLQPVGKHTVRVCRGTACHVRGSKLLLDTPLRRAGHQTRRDYPGRPFHAGDRRLPGRLLHRAGRHGGRRFSRRGAGARPRKNAEALRKRRTRWMSGISRTIICMNHPFIEREG